MSKAVQGAIAASVVLIVISIGFAFWALTQRQSLLQQNQDLQGQIDDDKKELGATKQKVNVALAQANKLQDNVKQLNDTISQKDSEKTQLQSQFDDLKSKADAFTAQLDQANHERDDWKGRMETIRKERDELMQKLKDRPVVAAPAPAAPAADAQAAAPAADNSTAPATPDVTSPQGDQYWASILKQKAALQLALDQAKSDLNQNMVQVVELKKQNSDLQLSIKQVTSDKEDLEHKLAQTQQDYDSKVKYGEELANNLSIEVAHSHNDAKFVNDRADKFKEDNLDLQNQIKQLTTTKLALEKAVSRLTDEKEGLQKKLVETESVIQNRIDEIWKIKSSVDQKLADNPVNTSSQVDLPPIVVNAKGSVPADNTTAQAAAPSTPEKQSSIISINQANNFVITDLGEASGVKVGHMLQVIRNDKPIATLEVIQVRKDICAADIKQKSDELKIGDMIKPFVN